MSAYTSIQQFIRLTDYLLLEYNYTTSPNPEIYYVNNGNPTVGFEKIINKYFNNSVQILNRQQDKLITNNVRNLSVVQIKKNNFVTLSDNYITSYLDTDTNLTDINNLPIIFPSNIGVYYDTIKIHIISGYNFDNLDGIILQVKFHERSDKEAIISQILVKKDDIDLPILNSNPIYFNGALYDHYIQIKIPSYENMCYEYDMLYGNIAQGETLGAKISSDGRGFIRDAPINFTVYEVLQTNIINGYENYITHIKSQISIPPKDNYGNLSAVIQENTTFNYIEYFPTWEGNFIEDFIYRENKIGNDYYLINEVEVKEQVGLTYITTNKFTSIETKNFNVPYIFRPIITNKLTTSFTINYTLKLINKKNNNQIIRRASYTSFDVNKYSKKNNNVILSTNIYTHKVYNKIVKPVNTLTNENNTNHISLLEKKIIPVFYKDNNISVTKEDLIIDKNGNLVSKTTTSDTTKIYGQGKLKIVIDPFDNFYKFTIYNLKGTSLYTLDLGTLLNYYIVFINENGESIKIENLKNYNNIFNPSLGQIIFKISKSYSEKILKFNSREFYIISLSSDGIETKLYSGLWQTQSEYLNENIQEDINKKPNIISNISNSISNVITNITEVNNVKPLNNIIESEQIISKVPISNITKPSKPYIMNSNSILSIIPSNNFKTPTQQSNNQQMINNVLTNITDNISNISNINNNLLLMALSDSIAGKEALGISIENIVNYYFLPGSPGSFIFKGINKNIFLSAVLQIHPPLPSGEYDSKYIQYCNILNFPISDNPIEEKIK